MTKSVLFLSPVRFLDLQQRHQAFACLLADKGYRVSFIEPFLSNGFYLQVAKQGPGLKVFKLKLPFTAREHPVLQHLSCNLAIRLLRRHLCPEKQILWLAEPAACKFTTLPFAKIIYDRCDHHGYFPGQRLETWQSYEKQIFRRADLITFTHANLEKDLPAAAKRKALLVGNACLPGNFTLTKAKKNESKIRVLSSGAHYEWVDFKWLRMLSDNELIELHIAGTGRGKEFDELIEQPGVIYHGKLRHKQLAELMASCHAGAIPFLESPLTRSVDPIKAYEYAAAGLKVWSTDIAGLRSNNLVDNRIDCSKSLSVASKNISRNEVTKSKSVSTWQQRLNRILDSLAQLRSD